MKPEGGSGKWEVGDSSQRALVALYFGSSSGLRRADFRRVSGAGRFAAGVIDGDAGAMPADCKGIPKTAHS